MFTKIQKTKNTQFMNERGIKSTLNIVVKFVHVGAY